MWRFSSNWSTFGYMNMDENKASPSHDVRTNTLSKCVGGESEVEKLFMFIQSENNLIISKFYHVEQENWFLFTERGYVHFFCQTSFHAANRSQVVSNNSPI